MLLSKTHISPWCARVQSIWKEYKEKINLYFSSWVRNINKSVKLLYWFLLVFLKIIVEEICCPSHLKKTRNTTKLQSDKYTRSPRKDKEVDIWDPNTKADT